FPLPMQIHQPQLYGTNSPYQSYLDRPLTARDFERLLNILVLRHQQYQRLGFSSGQNLFASGFNYRGNYNPYYHQIPQPPVYSQFDPRYTVFSRSLPPIPPPDSFYAPYSEQENMYQAQNQIEQQLPYSIQSRRNYDIKQFVNSYYRTNSNHFPHAKASTHENTEYLPQDIREDILWRMLMLSIHSDINANMANIPVPVASTIQTTTSLPESKKPVRSVQILGEE
ncbi:uncharacterized protein LOC129572040, partial [Sitodiplosis mosellana]|uniref:uncharacterized protein LOC129572040 n=1 Tax=Sitodiplosis mosellana TaxID=263140 RepID=UPI002444475B